MHRLLGRRLRAGVPLLQDVLAWWDFSDGSGPVLTDKGPGAAHGVLSNMDPATDWIPGPLGPCLDFDGTNDRVTATGYAPGWSGGGTSLAVLLTARSFASASWLSAYAGATRNCLLGVGVSAKPFFYSSLSDYVQTTATISAGSRVLVVGLTNGTQSSIYVNGALAAGPTTKAATYGVDQWRIADYGFDGTIEFAATWGRGLRDLEIRDLQSRLEGGDTDDLYEPLTPLVCDAWRTPALIPAAARAVSAA